MLPEDAFLTAEIPQEWHSMVRLKYKVMDVSVSKLMEDEDMGLKVLAFVPAVAVNNYTMGFGDVITVFR